MNTIILDVAALGGSFIFLLVRARAYMEYLKAKPNADEPSSGDPQTCESIMA